jgi:hypothetical protein
MISVPEIKQVKITGLVISFSNLDSFADYETFSGISGQDNQWVVVGNHQLG